MPIWHKTTPDGNTGWVELGGGGGVGYLYRKGGYIAGMGRGLDHLDMPEPQDKVLTFRPNDIVHSAGNFDTATLTAAGAGLDAYESAIPSDGDPTANTTISDATSAMYIADPGIYQLSVTGKFHFEFADFPAWQISGLERVEVFAQVNFINAGHEGENVLHPMNFTPIFAHPEAIADDVVVAFQIPFFVGTADWFYVTLTATGMDGTDDSWATYIVQNNPVHLLLLQVGVL